jgi:hydroxyquinol 1,2-dioxygenase
MKQETDMPQAQATTQGQGQIDADGLVQAVIDRMADCKDARFKVVMAALVKHLHAFAKDIELAPHEWMTAIQFLTATGQKCDEKRQEFILLSDTLGLSMQVVAIAQAKGAEMGTPSGTLQPGNGQALMAPTEATVQGPFYWEGAPELPLGSDLGAGMPGDPTYFYGRVTDTAGNPIAGCAMDVWSSDSEGFYDQQKGDDAPMELRARFHTDADGSYRYWAIKPALYPVPVDGPVGAMLTRMGRHPFRPGHMHKMLSAAGYQKLTTHIFVSDSKYLDSDAVFGVRNSLIVDFKAQPPGQAVDGRVMDRTYYTAHYDFRLAKSA